MKCIAVCVGPRIFGEESYFLSRLWADRLAAVRQNRGIFTVWCCDKKIIETVAAGMGLVAGNLTRQTDRPLS